MKLAVGRYHSNNIKEYSLEDGSTSPSQDFDGIIISALDCHIHVIPTKLKSLQQVAAFTQHYIKTVHPGPYDGLSSDFILTGRGENRRIILVIMEEDILKAYKAMNYPLYFFFQLGVNNSFSFQTEDYIETYTYENKFLKSVTIANESEIAPLSLNNPKVKKQSSLFQEHKKQVLKIKILPSLLFIILGFLALRSITSFGEYKELKETYENNQNTIKQLAQSQQKKVPQNDENKDLIELGLSIDQSIPRDYYTVLSKISKTQTNKMTIDSMKISNGNITFNGSTTSALKMIEELNATDLFSEIKPSKIYPSEDNKEDFSLTGVLK